MKTLERVLLSRREIDENGCWLYTRATVNGYGRIWFGGKQGYAHRLAAHLWLGLDLNSNLYVLHKRDCNRRCFNPDHLYVGTHADNVSDWVNRKFIKGLYEYRRRS